ncbi:MAG TPA: hypothetical protein VK589_06445, partial [Chryseolinea sp.]|nr:hypothetical protein [Chryseolinea sp.]
GAEPTTKQSPPYEVRTWKTGPRRDGMEQNPRRSNPLHTKCGTWKTGPRRDGMEQTSRRSNPLHTKCEPGRLVHDAKVWSRLHDEAIPSIRSANLEDWSTTRWYGADLTTKQSPDYNVLNVAGLRLTRWNGVPRFG